MLQKIKMTSYAFILFLVFAFSFIALQVTTEEVEAAPGVCEPVERIRNMKDTARHSDYKVWEERCQVNGSNGQCGNRAEWPAGDGGRCETTTADTFAAQDINTAAGSNNRLGAAIRTVTPDCENEADRVTRALVSVYGNKKARGNYDHPGGELMLGVPKLKQYIDEILSSCIK